MIRLFVAILLCASPAYAFGPTWGVIGGGIFIDTYSDITLWWRCEGLTLGAADYSAGDTSVSTFSGADINTDAVKIGTNGCDYPTVDDYHSLTVTGDDIVSDEEGRLGSYVRFVSMADGGKLGEVYGDANNYLRFATTATDELRFRWVANGVTATDLDTAAANLATNTWYYVEFAWKRSTNYREIFVDGVSAGSSSAALGNFATAVTSFRPGSATGTNNDHHQDNIAISNLSTRDFNALKDLTESPR